MNWLLLVLSFLPAVLPWAGRAVQAVTTPVQIVQAAQVVQTAFRPLQEAVPPEAGQPNVIFHEGRWWRWDGQQWWVWVPVQQPGGLTYAAR